MPDTIVGLLIIDRLAKFYKFQKEKGYLTAASELGFPGKNQPKRENFKENDCLY